VLKDNVSWKDAPTDIHDIMNPSKMFVDGKRMRDHSVKDLPPFSAKLMPEFDKRRNIKDMFKRHASFDSKTLLSQPTAGLDDSQPALITEQSAERVPVPRWSSKEQHQAPTSVKRRISTPTVMVPANKKSKAALSTASSSNLQKGQRTLQGFFQKKVQPLTQDTIYDGFQIEREETSPKECLSSLSQLSPSACIASHGCTPSASSPTKFKTKSAPCPTGVEDFMQTPEVQDESRPPSSSGSDVHDPIVAKEGWTKLFTKKQPPRCEDHDEPCTLFQTKKKGFNSGRSFWICARYVMLPRFRISSVSLSLSLSPSLSCACRLLLRCLYLWRKVVQGFHRLAASVCVEKEVFVTVVLVFFATRLFPFLLIL
jgi:AP endonuclease-2